MRLRLASTLAASALALAAGGCAHRATEHSNSPTTADNHKIEVTRADENLPLSRQTSKPRSTPSRVSMCAKATAPSS
jgi:hypothetical protein